MRASNQLLLPLSRPETVWKLAGASVTGTRHIRQKQSCQDAASAIVDRDFLCIAVADGAGSASHAALGSAVASQAALTAAAHFKAMIGRPTGDLARAVLKYSFDSAVCALRNTAAKLGITTSDLACTLITIVAVPEAIFVGHVGDGAVVVGDDVGNLLTLSTPTNGEFANETPLLGCSDTVDANIQRHDPLEFRNVAVFSDGIQRLALNSRTHQAHHGFFRPLFEQLRNDTEERTEELIKEFLSSPRVTARTDDDATLFLARLP